MRYGSLFAGIGGIDLGLDRAGMTPAWQVEKEEYCQKVLTKHWPDVPKFSNIRDCGKQNLEKVDLIAGGFPCQDISEAGKKAGINGKKSGLWKEFHRIICELRPSYVLVENVSALRRRGLDTVLGDLAKIGYDAEWESITARAVGAPHQRDRLFIVGYPHREQFNYVFDGGRKEGSETFASSREVYPNDSGSDTLPDTGRKLLEGGQSERSANRSTIRDNAEWWTTESSIRGMVDEFPEGLDGGRLDANAKKTRPKKVLCDMREEIEEKEISRTSGMFGKFQEKEVLRPNVYGEGLFIRSSFIALYEEIPQETVQKVWGEVMARRSPQGQESFKSISKEFANALCQVSHYSSLGRGKNYKKEASFYMSCLWKTIFSSRAMPYSFDQIKEAWASLSSEEKTWAFMAANLGPWWSEWPEVCRVAKGVPNRVPRLRGLGNAVVPQVAEYIGKLIMEDAKVWAQR